MSEDVATTKRKPLTPTQRLALFEAYKGLCCVCGFKIHLGEKWIDEHLRALGLGGTNQWDNRGPAHVKCAEIKTVGDMAAINKAKAQKRSALGIKNENRAKIRKPPKEPKSPLVTAQGQSGIWRQVKNG
jgi:5-methylcytosine-specific restriction protein A